MDGRCKIFALTGLMLATACGSRTSVEPSTARQGGTFAPQRQIDIPPLTSEADDRGLIGRYLGVPVDQSERQQWAFNYEQAAISECMSARGLPYLVGDAPGEADPNVSYIEGLDDAARAEYVDELWGADVVDPTDESCEATARLRVFPVNSVQEEWDGLQQRIMATQAVSTALEAFQACTGEAGYSDAHGAPEDVVRGCERASEITAIIADVSERLEMEFLLDHAEFFAEFKANLPEVLQ